MTRTTYLVCDACGGRVATCVQANGSVVPAEPVTIANFYGKHILECRKGKITTAEDKGFHTDTETQE